MKRPEVRNWTEADVLEAVTEMKKNPELWQEIEHIEKTTGDFRDTDTGSKETRILARLHPECSLFETTDLYQAVRKYRRAQLGLK